MARRKSELEAWRLQMCSCFSQSRRVENVTAHKWSGPHVAETAALREGLRPPLLSSWRQRGSAAAGTDVCGRIEAAQHRRSPIQLPTHDLRPSSCKLRTTCRSWRLIGNPRDIVDLLRAKALQHGGRDAVATENDAPLCLNRYICDNSSSSRLKRIQ